MLPATNPNVVFCVVEDGAVLLSTAEEVYFGLNEVGARVWQLLTPEHTTLGSLCDVLVREYPDAPRQDIVSDVRDLLRELERHDLVRPSPTDP